MGSTAIIYHNPSLNSDNNQIINNSSKQKKIFKINMYQNQNPNVNKKIIKEIKKKELIKNDKNKNKYNNNVRAINLLKNNLGYKKHINLIKSNEIIKEESDFIDENSGRNNYMETDNINSNLSEFIINNDKYYHYDYDENKANHKSVLNKNSNSKTTNNATNTNNDLLSSERTINMTNSDAEYFTDNYSKSNNNNKNNSNNSKNKINNNSRRSSYQKYNKGKNNQYFDKFKNKNNIFNNVRIYEMNDNDKKIKESKSHSSIHKINLIKNDKEYIKENNKDKNIRKTDSKNIKRVKSIKQSNQKKYNSTKKIHNSNSNNNVFLESKYLSNSNNNSYCRINKASSYNKINTIYKSSPNEKVNNNIHKNFSFKNISNNIILNQKKFKESNNTKVKKRNNNNTIGKNQINNYSNSVKQISSNNYSYNYNNFYIYNDAQNFKLKEKQKMTELIEKIPNKELKNEIMTLYQRIINYNNEVIINKRSNSFNYIITFSNNYINMNEKKFSGKQFDQSNFLINKEINIQFISMNFNNKFKNECQDNIIYFISNNNENKKQNNMNNYIKGNDIIISDENNEDFFKQYTFKKRENDSNNSQKSKDDINEQIKQNRNTTSNNSNNNQIENKKFELNTVNKFWNKIINKIEMISNKDKKEKLDSNYIHSRKKSIQIMRRNYTLGNEENNNIKKSNSLKTIYTKSNGDKNNSNKNNKFYSIFFRNEKILFEQSINKLMKLRELLKRIQNSIKNKNKILKEDALIMFSCICILSNSHFMIYKDKESMKPLFKKRINLIKQLLIFKRANKFIIIIKFQDVNKNMNFNINININNNDIYHRQNEKEENIIGILINKENIYIEFIKILKLLIPYLEIVFLN